MENPAPTPTSRLLLIACVVDLVLVAAAFGVAAKAENQCCIPAHAIYPTPVFDVKDSCVKKKNDMTQQFECLRKVDKKSPPPECGGVSWQAYKEGRCEEQKKSSCDEKGVFTSVVILRGRWKCDFKDGACGCQWQPESDKSGPISKTQDMVKNCVGGACDNKVVR